jgi:predicted metal-dependent hydrolase
MKSMKVTINNKEVSVCVTRKNRKTISMKISDNSQIIVSAPTFISDSKIKEILKEKEKWITETLRNMEDRINEDSNLKEGILYLGRMYKIELHNVKHNSLKIIFDNSMFNLYIPEVLTEKDKLLHSKELLIKWYKIQARRVFEERVNYYSNILKVSPNRIAIKDQKFRWGSCSSKGNINLNYRLIMAPIEVINYVVVHELCHLVHLNHFKDFWELVEVILPDYLKCKEWLKINGSTLNV